MLFVLVIQALKDLPKGSFANHLQHLKAIGYVIVSNLQNKNWSLLYFVKSCVLTVHENKYIN